MIVVLIMISTIGASIGVQTTKINDNATQPSPNLNRSLNESQYISFSDSALKGFEADAAYSSGILGNYAKKNITDREALVETMAVYELLSHAKDLLSLFSPPKKYEVYYRNIIFMMTYTQDYLWNMGRFYETHNVNYLRMARANYNSSTFYHDKILEQQILNQ